ncbi:UNVERIFIED_CONTAM: hypothetical protein Sindi_3063900, partial [Sesamum indicum]
MEVLGDGEKYSGYVLSFALSWITRLEMETDSLFGRTRGITWVHLSSDSLKVPAILDLKNQQKLSLVISAGEWQWPTITDFECLEITHNLPLIFGGEDRVVWRCDEGQPTTQALYRLFTHPEPKVGWSSLLLGSLKIPRHSFILMASNPRQTSYHRQIMAIPPGDLVVSAFMRFAEGFAFTGPIEIGQQILNGRHGKWRGEHIINRAYRTLLAACVYHIWKERNLRRFDHTERTPATLSILIINDVRQRILSVDLASSVQYTSI